MPAGTIHALGAGLLVAEIQQSSDTTYRLFDWNRLGPDGRRRPLRTEEGLDVVDFARGPVMPQRPQPTDRPQVSRLVECDKFIWDRWDFDSPLPAGGDDRCHILTVLDGAVRIAGDPAGFSAAARRNRSAAGVAGTSDVESPGANGVVGRLFAVANRCYLRSPAGSKRPLIPTPSKYIRTGRQFPIPQSTSSQFIGA